MSGSTSYAPRTRLGRFVHEFEETTIAVILGVMTVITFVNVVLRYLFNSMVIWGLEVVVILFAWLVLFGAAYGFKITAHLGVDALINICSPSTKRILGLVSAALCIAYVLLIAKGSWDYWAPFAGLQETTGRWFPTGFNENTRDRAFFVTDQVPMPFFLRWLEDAINLGEPYPKMPRVVPYTILPIASVLMLWRLIEVTIRIWRGEETSLVASHEAEDAVAEASHRVAGRE